MMMKNLSKKVKNLDFLDFFLMLISSLCLGVFIVRFIPELLDTNPWWWLALAMIFALRPKIRFWFSPPA